MTSDGNHDSCTTYINTVVKLDNSFNTLVNDLDLRVYHCRWEFVAMMHQNFVYIRNHGVNDVQEHVQRLIQHAISAYATTHAGVPDEIFVPTIQEYVLFKYGL